MGYKHKEKIQQNIHNACQMSHQQVAGCATSQTCSCWVGQTSPPLGTASGICVFACLKASETNSQVAGCICVAEAKMMGFSPPRAYSLTSWLFLYSRCQTVVAINSFFLPSDSQTYRPTAPKQNRNFSPKKLWLLLHFGTD